MIMRNPKEELEEYLETLTNYTLYLGGKTKIADFLRKSKDNETDLEILSSYRHFFRIVREAVEIDVVLTLSKFFDRNKKGLNRSEKNLLDYLDKTKDNIKPICKSVFGQEVSEKKVNKLKSEIEKQIAQIKNKQSVIDEILDARDKFYAHYDNEFFKKPENVTLPSFQEFYELENYCREVLNWHRWELFQIPSTGWWECGGASDLSSIFSIIKNHKERKKKLIERIDEFQCWIDDEIIDTALREYLAKKNYRPISRKDIEIINQNAEIINKFQKRLNISQIFED